MVKTAMESHADLVLSFKNAYNEFMNIIKDVVSKGQLQQEIRCDMNSSALTRSIGSLIHGIIFEWKVKGEMGNLETAIKEISEFTLFGVKYQCAVQNTMGLNNI
jgi:hypothetical protein